MRLSKAIHLGLSSEILPNFKLVVTLPVFKKFEPIPLFQVNTKVVM